MLPWTALQYVTSGLTLVAFLSVITLAIYRSRLRSREALIRSAPEDKRSELVKSTLQEFFNINTADLTKEQAYRLEIEQIHARSRRFAISATLIALLGLFTLLAWLLPGKTPPGARPSADAA